MQGASAMNLNVIPLSIVDKAWANELDIEVDPVLSAMSVLVFDRRLGARPVCVRLPESMGTLVDAAGSFRYVAGQNWRVSKDGDWSYSGTSLQQFGGNAPCSFNGEISCATRVEDSTLIAELTLCNGGFATWKSPYLWVCVLYKYAPAFHSQTLVSVGGSLIPYEQTYPQFFGPAGMRALTGRGLAQIERLEREGYCVDGQFPRDVIAEPVRAARACVDGRDLAVTVRSEQAVLVGGYDENPCSDLAVGFGDVAPGGRSTAVVKVSVIEGAPTA